MNLHNWSNSAKRAPFKRHFCNFNVKGMVELADLMKGGGPCLHFWFKSSNFLGARLIRVRNSYNKIKLNFNDL